MGPDFIQRFFKLTLDNVYRFTCSVLFVVAVVGEVQGQSPIEQLEALLSWLAIPSAWLVPVADWITERAGLVGFVGALVLLVAILFAAVDKDSRSGSTALLSAALLFEVGKAEQVEAAFAIAFISLVVVTGGAHLVTRRMGFASPGWTESAWERAANVFISLMLSAAYMLSPLGWLISQEPYAVRGSRWNPIFVEQTKPARPSGAAPA